jgi:adenosylcobinamide kinase / adenosylcobinamide-phosphate guanylyltransferase
MGCGSWSAPRRPQSASSPPRRPERVLVLGAARSGKSALAESLLADIGHVVYVATGGERPDDPDWSARVHSHQARRPPGWSTEVSTDLVGLLSVDGPPLLIDCLTLWLTAVMDDADAWDETAWHHAGSAVVTQRVDHLVAAWRTTSRRVVAVSNEVGSGVVPDTWAGRLFRDEMGRSTPAWPPSATRSRSSSPDIETRLR